MHSNAGIQRTPTLSLTPSDLTQATVAATTALAAADTSSTVVPDVAARLDYNNHNHNATELKSRQMLVYRRNYVLPRHTLANPLVVDSFPSFSIYDVTCVLSARRLPIDQH
jgi:hypothetical protein